MRKSELKKLPIGSIFHLDYKEKIYKYVKISSEYLKRIEPTDSYGVLSLYNITTDFKMSKKNSILIDTWYFDKGLVKVVKIEKPIQYGLFYEVNNE